MTRGWLGRLLLATAALLTALVAVELLAPFVLPRRGCAGGRPPFWRPDAAVGWALIPGARGEAVVCAGARELARHAIEINALGQRDCPRTLARTGGTPRILVLGDSFVEGMQVDLGETFAARLERDLGVEVLNGGVSGYTTDNELRAFVARGRRYAPDAVLLVFQVGNDVLENGARLSARHPRGVPAKSWLRAPDATPALAACLEAHRAAARLADATPLVLWTHSRIVRFGLTDGTLNVLAILCAPALDAPTLDLLDVYGEPRTPAWAEAWATTETLLPRLRARVERSGARFAVAVAPASFEVQHPLLAGRRLDWDYPHRRLAALFARERIAWTSLLPALRAHHQATGRTGSYELDGHWDADGHAVVAAALRPLVEQLVLRP